MNEGERRKEAREIAEARLAFWRNLAAYIVVNPGLVALWYFLPVTTGPFAGGDSPFAGGDTLFWPIFPIILWGVVVVGHFIWAYRRRPGRDWIARETERILKAK